MAPPAHFTNRVAEDWKAAIIASTFLHFPEMVVPPDVRGMLAAIRRDENLWHLLIACRCLPPAVLPLALYEEFAAISSRLIEISSHQESWQDPYTDSVTAIGS